MLFEAAVPAMTMAIAFTAALMISYDLRDRGVA
jgi:hypothetical protein